MKIKSLSDIVMAVTFTGICAAFSVDGCIRDEKKDTGRDNVTVEVVDEGKRDEIGNAGKVGGDDGLVYEGYEDTFGKVDNLFDYVDERGVLKQSDADDDFENKNGFGVKIDLDAGEQDYSIDRISYSEFKRAVGKERLAHMTGHSGDAGMDLLRSFYDSVNNEHPGTLVGLSYILNLESYFCIRGQEEEYNKFDPEKLAEKSIWKPIRDEDGNISNSDKWTYFVINNDDSLREKFLDVSGKYKKIEGKLVRN